MHIADETAKTLDDFNRITTQILLTDLDLAFTFADIAATRNDPEIRMRNIRNARKAYNEIAKRSQMLPMEETAASRIDAGLQLLKYRLSQLGEVFDSPDGP